MYKGKIDKDDLLIDSVFNNAVAEVLKELRNESGMSLQQLANKMNNIITRQTLNRYELGLSKIRMNVFFELAKAFKLKPEELYEKINIRYIQKLSQYSDELIKKDKGVYYE